MTTNMAENSDSDWEMVEDEPQSFAPVFLGSKYFIIQTENTRNVNEAIIKRLKNDRPNLQEVFLVEECDFILLFCPVVSRAGTDIEAAMKELQKHSDTKPAVLMVLHHTSDPECVLPGSSSAVNRINTIIVHWRFHEDQGLLQCPKNDESLAVAIAHMPKPAPVQGWLVSPLGNLGSQASAIQDKNKTPEPPVFLGSKYFIIQTENTMNVNEAIIKRLKNDRPNLQEVFLVEECDVILLFCPVISQAGTDIEAAMKELQKHSDTKPAVLMVLHHTFDPECVLPGSSSAVNRINTIIVHWRFHEDQGLLQCLKNDESLAVAIAHMPKPAPVQGWLVSMLGNRCNSFFSQDPAIQDKNKTPEHEDGEDNRTTGRRYRKYFTVKVGTPGDVCGVEETFNNHGFKKVPDLDKCDVILTLCTDVSFKPAVKVLNTLLENGEKLGVLVVFRSESDPNGFAQYQGKKHITVEWLYCKDQGFFQCKENDEALRKIINWLYSVEISKKNEKGGFSNFFGYVTNPPLHYHTLISGPTLGIYSNIEKKLQERYSGLKKVQNLEMSDVVLLFCPVVSRAESNIKAAVRILDANAGNKPAVLLVLHHTFDPNHIVPDSSKAVKREKTIAVDCLFHEDQGLLTCSQNLNALSWVGQCLRDWADKKKSVFKQW